MILPVFEIIKPFESASGLGLRRLFLFGCGLYFSVQKIRYLFCEIDQLYIFWGEVIDAVAVLIMPELAIRTEK